MASLPPPTSQAFQPLNEEPSIKKLISSTITSTQDSYSRNHGPIPHLNGPEHRIQISDSRLTQSPPQTTASLEPLLHRKILLSLADLNSLPQTTLICALQCAGNRRHDMRTRIKEVDGIDWGSGAVMNAAWTGVLLVDLFSHLLGRPADQLHSNHQTHPKTNESPGISTLQTPSSSSSSQQQQQQQRHIAFSCTSVPTEEDTYFASSLPLSLALSPHRQILLATHQNGQPLTPEHGFPVRLIVPGIAGARSVKWLDRITVQDAESMCFYMQRDYKILPPWVGDAGQAEREGWWGKTGPLSDMPVNSVVSFVGGGGDGDGSDGDGGGNEGEQEKVAIVKADADGRIFVKGYALPGGDGGPVTRVEIRVDEGDWEDAELLPFTACSSTDKDQDQDRDQYQEDAGQGKWSWMLWRAEVKVEKGRHTIWSRASDYAGNRQQEERSEWNLRGVAYNGFGEMEVDVV